MKIFSLKKYVIFLVLLVAFDCALGGFIGVWREWYWAALSNKDFHKWMLYVAEFSGVALLSCLVSGYSTYLVGILALHFRTLLTKKAFKLKLQGIEGQAQRVQEDCQAYPSLALNLATGMFRSVIMIVVFTVIILKAVSPLYLLIPIVYSLVGTLIAGKIAFPLINLNYINQVFEAKLRHVLDRIAHTKYAQSFIDVHRNNFKLYKQTKYLNYFQNFFGQISIIIPHLALATLYFSGKIVFGVFMQVAASMNEITDNLGWVINSFDVINKFLSCRKRLKEIGII